MSTLHAADDKSWTWKDKDGVEHSRAELDSLLSQHKKWLDTKEKEGKQANLNGAILIGAQLQKADLSEAELEKAVLDNANLSEAQLLGAHLESSQIVGTQLQRADLSWAHLHAAQLSGSNLHGATFGGEADLSEARFVDSDLSEAHFEKAILSGAHLEQSNLKGANLSWARLNGANLSRADLTGAWLFGTDLSGADLRDANLHKVIYEPAKSPSMDGIAWAKGLASLTWTSNSQPVVTLRKSLVDAGFKRQAQLLNAAIHRHDQSPLERFLFDWTCEWGANWLRPLELVGLLSAVCTFVYWIGMHFHRKSGLYLAATGERITTSKGKERVFRINVTPAKTVSKPKAKTTWRSLRNRLSQESRALGTAFLFSLMSVFNIGVQWLDVGRWIRMLQPRQFDIRARGWMRTVSGIQSLIGVALLALSLLSYFGHPFE